MRAQLSSCRQACSTLQRSEGGGGLLFERFETSCIMFHSEAPASRSLYWWRVLSLGAMRHTC